MPRLPLGDRAMTDAERQRKRRERLRQERGPALTDRQKLIEAQKEIERLRQRTEPQEGSKSDSAPGEVRRLESALEDANTDLYELGIEADRMKRLLADKPGVNKDELIEKLRPIVDGLMVEGKKSQVRVSTPQILSLGGQLKRLLEEWGVVKPKPARHKLLRPR
jgi:hypothetical protein